MNFILQPWQLLVVALASWVHREQQKIIQFYQAEIKALMELTTIVTPDTILRWHRTLLAQK